MPKKATAWQVRHTDGTIRIVMAHSLRGAARIFCVTYAVETAGVFKVKERLGGNAWTVFTRTKVGIRMLGTE